MRTCSAIGSAALLGFIVSTASSARAGIVEVGGSAALADPPPSILLHQWESDTEIRGWFERQTTLTSNLTLGHVNSGFVNDQSQLVSGVVPLGTTVESYMFRLDPVGNGPVLLSGYVIFDTPILGVFIGNQLGATDALLGRPGVAYNQNSFRGLELDGPGPSMDSFEISADRLRIDFVMAVGDWTDDIRIVTAAVPAPPVAALLALGGLAGRRRR